MLRKIKKGFTLVEVMVAMLVLSIGLLGLAGITILVLRSTALSQQISEATNLATDLMETLKTTDQATLFNLTCDDHNNSYTDLQDLRNEFADCPVITQSGLLTIDGVNSWNYLPPRLGGDGDDNCALSNILGADQRAAEITTADFNSTDFTTVGSGTFCKRFDSTQVLDPGQYIRYYRVKQPDGGPASERRITVGVLWVHQGKWRKVHFTTIVSN